MARQAISQKSMRCAIAAALFATSVSVTACGGSAGPQSATDPVLDLFEFMFHAMDPAAKDFWAGWGEVHSANGVERVQPTSEAEWKRVEDGAATVVLLGSLLRSPTYRPENAGSDWDRFAQAVSVTAERGRLAAANQQTADLGRIGEELYAACKACHDAYKPKE